MAVSYVGIDTQGARALAQVLQETADRVDGIRSSVSAALVLADLASQVPAQLARVQEGFTTLAAGVADKAELAERYVVDPQGTAASLGAPVDTLGAAISGLLGFAGPSELRGVLLGLPAPGADPALDGALARLNPVLLPAFQSGQRPELTEAQTADLKLVALALGIERAGPPVARVAPQTGEAPRGFLGRFWAAAVDNGAPPAVRGFLARAQERTGTEVFWNDFWTGGRTVENVLSDPDLLLQWVAGTFELDRRLALATGLPTLGDILSSVDFATKGSDPGELAAILSAAETEFAAIAGWLPAFLVGQDRTGPDATRLAQTLAFASRVGWPDPGAAVLSEQDRFADAIAFLRANRALQSALLPTGFEGDSDPLAFFNEPGIGFVLDLGRRTGVLDDTVLASISGTVDQAIAAFGVDLSGPAPAVLTEQLQQQLFALLSTQIPRSQLEVPATQAQFIAALGYLRAAATGPEQRQRLIEVLAAFRTLAVTGAPALTERQLVSAVGGKVLGVLGRSRLRLRSQAAVQKNPEFLLVARQWGLPGGRKEQIGKYKFTWSFNDLGELTAIGRKKKHWLSRAWDTVKAIGKAIWKSWEDNPLKAIFQVGKIALGALAFVVPGLQGLGAAAFALSVGETALHAVQGDWLAAIGSGLAAFTAGASDVFSTATSTIVDTAQHAFAGGLLSPDTLSFLKDAKRVFDIGTAIFNATQANSLIGAIGAGFGAVTTALGGGGQLLGSLKLIDDNFAKDLARIGLSVADVARFVTPTAGLVDALNKDNVPAAFGNGLSILAAGARVVSNPAGAFAGQKPPLGGVFGFDEATQRAIFSLSQHAGAAAGVAKAIDAANRGDTAAAGTFLAQAVQALNDPVLKDPAQTAIANRAKVAERIAEIGVLFEAVFEKRTSATAVAPLVLQRLQAVLDAGNARVAQPSARPATRSTAGSAPVQATALGIQAPGTARVSESLVSPVTFGAVPTDAAEAETESTPTVHRALSDPVDAPPPAMMRLGLGGFGIALPQDETTAEGSGDLPVVLTAGGSADAPEFTLPSLADAQARPLDAARWWGLLTPEQQQQFVSDNPQLIGEMGGIPVVDRSRANLFALDRFIQEQQALVDELSVPRVTSDPETAMGQVIQLAQQSDRLNQLIALRDRVEVSAHGPEAERLYLLGIDNGGTGRATVSVGNPDTALYVGVMAPGMTVHFPGLLNDWIPRATALRAEAELLAMQTPGEPGRVATVVYLYHTPDLPIEPARREHAEAAAPGLGRIIDGLRVSSQLDPSLHGIAFAGVTPPQGGSRIGVYTHSYGTLLLLPAAVQGGLDGANFTFTLGGPGFGVPHRSLFPFQGEVFSGANPNDPVPWFVGPPFHGIAPHTFEWGGTRVEVDPDTSRFFPNLWEHSRYWEPYSLRQQALALLGSTEEMTLRLSDQTGRLPILGLESTLAGAPAPLAMPGFGMSLSHYTLDTLAEPGRPVYRLVEPESGTPSESTTDTPTHFPDSLMQPGYMHIPGALPPLSLTLPGAGSLEPPIHWNSPDASWLLDNPIPWHLLDLPKAPEQPAPTAPLQDNIFLGPQLRGEVVPGDGAVGLGPSLATYQPGNEAFPATYLSPMLLADTTAVAGTAQFDADMSWSLNAEDVTWGWENTELDLTSAEFEFAGLEDAVYDEYNAG